MGTWDDSLGPGVTQASFSFSASGDNIVITGAAGAVIKVLQFFLVVAAPTSLTYKSGASTILSGPLVFTANAAQVQDFIHLPLTCRTGDNFVVNSSNAVGIGGTVWYVLGGLGI